mmetsp:Transcript_41119/g.96061  ORF Transcript_41119/g.96061 Transcript_41119/m.96061 type:complete len:204 (-) Transcript_41119:54-665(-)
MSGHTHGLAEQLPRQSPVSEHPRLAALHLQHRISARHEANTSIRAASLPDPRALPSTVTDPLLTTVSRFCISSFVGAFAMAAYAADPTTPPFSSSISLSHSSIEAERLLIEIRHEFLLLLSRGKRLLVTPGSQDRSEVGDAGSRHGLRTPFPSSRPSWTRRWSTVTHQLFPSPKGQRSESVDPSEESGSSQLPQSQGLLSCPL